MAEHGGELLGAALDLAGGLRDQLSEIPGLRVMEDELLGHEASHELDRLQILMDVSETGTSGYQGADWLRHHCHIDLGMSDHRRILATVSFADDKDTADRLVAALRKWRAAADCFDPPPQMMLPAPGDIELETVMLPRDAFFGPVDDVPADQATGRIAAEQITPYPPGIPAAVPGERLNAAVIDYLRSGVAAGMNLPDPADQQLTTIRVVAA